MLSKHELIGDCGVELFQVICKRLSPISPIRLTGEFFQVPCASCQSDRTKHPSQLWVPVAAPALEVLEVEPVVAVAGFPAGLLAVQVRPLWVHDRRRPWLREKSKAREKSETKMQMAQTERANACSATMHIYFGTFWA